MCYAVTFIVTLSVVDNSAKVTDANEITPQSNYVTILNNGACAWEPRFDQSVSQCHIDVMWFPFDEQTCDLVFESWLLPHSVLKLETYGIYLSSSVDPHAWYITGVY